MRLMSGHVAGTQAVYLVSGDQAYNVSANVSGVGPDLTELITNASLMASLSDTSKSKTSASVPARLWMRPICERQVKIRGASLGARSSCAHREVGR